LRDVIPDPSACLVYACGPAISPWDKKAAAAKGAAPTPRFLETVLSELQSIGVKDEQIEYESYG
jgi:hypothetical protein